MSQRIYGVIYGFVCGVVAAISVLEFLPTALLFDESQGKNVVSTFFLAGMLLLASTLIVEML